jgi:hypothetical protein
MEAMSIPIELNFAAKIISSFVAPSGNAEEVSFFFGVLGIFNELNQGWFRISGIVSRS